MMASFQCVAALTISFMMLSAPVQGSGFPRRPGDATLQTPSKNVLFVIECLALIRMHIPTYVHRWPWMLGCWIH